MWWHKVHSFCKQTGRYFPQQKSIRDERGQSLVEFAITLPLLLLLVLGTFDLGLGFKTYMALTNAAREGVRAITLYPSDQNLAYTRIEAEASKVGLTDDLLAERHYTVSISPSGPYKAGDRVTVNVHHEYEPLFQIIPGVDKINFTASATMVVLYDQ
jgi:Flp pilus assembly protein TadG